MHYDFFSALRLRFSSGLRIKRGYKSRISYADADYFNLPEKGRPDRQGGAREGPVPTLEQINHVLSVMPAKTDIELRDRALIAFTRSEPGAQGRRPEPRSG